MSEVIKGDLKGKIHPSILNKDIKIHQEKEDEWTIVYPHAETTNEMEQLAGKSDVAMNRWEAARGIAQSVSFSKFYGWVESKLSPTLVIQKDKTKMLECTGLVHSDIPIRCFGFECPLKGSDRWGDLLFKVLTNDLHTFLETSPKANILPGFDDHPLGCPSKQVD